MAMRPPPRQVPVLAAPVALPSPAGFGGPWRGSRRVPIQVVLHTTEQWLTLLQAGLPLDRALIVCLGTVEHPVLQHVLQQVVVDVEKGHTLAEALAQHPKVFPRLYTNMVRAGEEGGALLAVLQRVIEYYQRSLEFRAFLITSSIYPVLLLLFGVGALVALLVFVLPKFAQIFSDMGQAMPLAAALLVGAGEGLRQWGVWMLMALALAVLAGRQALRDPATRFRWQAWQLAWPVWGAVRLKIQLATVCRTWGTLLASGVPVLTGLRIVRELSDHLPLQQALDRLARAIQEGRGVSAPMLADPLFPKLLGQLVRVGEEAGALEQMLVRVADQYERDIQKATRQLMALFEPLMILLMGGLIGLVVVSMLTAVFSLNDLPL